MTIKRLLFLWRYRKLYDSQDGTRKLKSNGEAVLMRFLNSDFIGRDDVVLKRRDRKFYGNCFPHVFIDR